MNDSIWFWLYSILLVCSTMFLVFKAPWDLFYTLFEKPLKSSSLAQEFVAYFETKDAPIASDTKSGNLVSLLMTIIGIVAIGISINIVFVYFPETLEARLENSIAETVKLESGKLLYPHDPKWNVYCVSICIVCALLVGAIRIVSNIEKASAKQILAETRELFWLVWGLLMHDVIVTEFLRPDLYSPDFYNYLWWYQFSVVYDLALLDWNSNAPFPF